LFANILVVTDNLPLKNKFAEIVEPFHDRTFHYRYSSWNTAFAPLANPLFKPISIRRQVDEIIESYDLIISLHCKQIFPASLVEKVMCINVHPGLNPHNRGWYPQVFSILNKKPIGATIHVMDDQVDHGPIIAQREVPVYSYDTSGDVYNRVLQCEMELLTEHIEAILSGTFATFSPDSEGNYNSINDFEKLKEINLDESFVGKEWIDRLRALTHGSFQNAYFYDEDGSQIFVKLILERKK
jgi:methionyl-tRNA formyltransferase